MGSIGRKIMLVVLSACAFDGRDDYYEERLNSWSVIHYLIQEKSNLIYIDIFLNVENNPCFKSTLEELKTEHRTNKDNRLVQSASKIYYNEEEILVLENSNLPTYSESSSFYFITKPKALIHEISRDNVRSVLSEITMSEFDSIYNLKKDTYKTLDASIIKDSFKRVLGWELR